MKTVKYELISSPKSEDNTIRYGMRCISPNATAITIEDISSNKETVLRLVKNCNTYKLSPIHIFDVIDDVIG